MTSFYFLPKTLSSGNCSLLFVGTDAGVVSHATLPPCSSVLACPRLACPPLHLPAVVSFLRASSSEPKQQFHLFSQGWECTQPSLAVFLPAPLGAKPVDLTHMPALLLLSLSFSLSASVCDSASVYISGEGSWEGTVSVIMWQSGYWSVFALTQEDITEWQHFLLMWMVYFCNRVYDSDIITLAQRSLMSLVFWVHGFKLSW